MLKCSRLHFLFISVIVCLCSLAYSAESSIAIWSVERINSRARSSYPSEDPLLETFEKVMARNPSFELIPSSKAREYYSKEQWAGSVFRHRSTSKARADFLVRIFISEFSDRVELDAHVYNSIFLPKRYGSSGAVVYAASYTAHEPVDIIDSIEKITHQISNAIMNQPTHSKRSRLFALSFYCREKAIEVPIYRMFVSELVRSGFYAVITSESGAKASGGYVHKDEERYSLADWSKSDAPHKKNTAQYNLINARIDGSVAKIADEYQISVSLEDPIRKINLTGVSVPLGTSPDAVRRASSLSAQVLMREYENALQNKGDVIDAELYVYSASRAESATTTFSDRNGISHKLTLTLSMRNLRTKQMRPWYWAGDEEAKKAYAWLKVTIEGREVLTMDIDYTAHGVNEREPLKSDIPGYPLELQLYKVSADIQRQDIGVFGVYQYGYLDKVTVRALVRRK